MDLFNLISALNPTNVKTRTRPRTANEVPLLTVTVSRVIDMEDVAMASESSGTPSTIEKSPLDFANEDQPQIITEGVVAAMGPPVNKRRHKRGNNEVEANAPPKSSKGTTTKILTEDVATAEVNIQFSMRSPESGRSSSVPSMVGSAG
nr:hypothetical protein [Tanacetum cinerariifolium]